MGAAVSALPLALAVIGGVGAYASIGTLVFLAGYRWWPSHMISGDLPVYWMGWPLVLIIVAMSGVGRLAAKIERDLTP